MIERMRSRLRDDAGISLAEILVYAVLLGIVLIAAASIFATTIRTEAQVRGSSVATSTATVVADAIGAGIRNASDFQVTAGTEADDLLLRARTSAVRVSSGGAVSTDWQCAAWYFDASENAIFQARQATAFAATVDPMNDGWQRIGDDIAAIDASTPVFAGSAALSLSFVTTSESAAPVRVSNLIYKRLQADTTTGPVACF